MLIAGCVFPPSLSVDTSDGGVDNSPPAITSIFADGQVLSDSGTVRFNRDAINPQMTLGLLDTDLNDTLYVRIYIDYTVDSPQPARAGNDCAPTGDRTRTCNVDIGAMCPAVKDGYAMTVQVFDRALAMDNSSPRYKSMMGKGGLTTNRSYTLDCVQEQ
ncbi:MAG TPA: hypothetical protein VGM90_38560 [Kofleriaceae bacterium]|jgi:hypothetical protein